MLLLAVSVQFLRLKFNINNDGIQVFTIYNMWAHAKRHRASDRMGDILILFITM